MSTRLSNTQVAFAQVIEQVLTIKCSRCGASRQMKVKGSVYLSGGDFAHALEKSGWKVRVTHKSNFDSPVVAMFPLCPKC